MAKKYVQKLVVTGNIVEYYRYDKWQFYDFTREKDREISINEKNFRSKYSNVRSSRMIRGLVNSNAQLNKFLTLTFADNIKDLSVANYEFKKGCQRIKDKFGKWSYVAVVEFQERGAVHYHLVCDLDYIPKKFLQDVWSNGFIEINRVRIQKEVGGYFVKNLCKYNHRNLGVASSSHGTKDNYKVEAGGLAGRKKFFCSRGLNRPIEIKTKIEIKRFVNKYLFGRKPFYEKIFASDFCKVEYKEFAI